MPVVTPPEDLSLEIPMSDPAPRSEPYIFSTLYRDKHSNLVSYSLGAEALSRALDGVPQHAALTCQFFAGNAHQHLDKPLQLVMSASYQRRNRSFHDGQDADARGVFLPRWTITVFAVPRTLRHAIKTAVLTEGLPSIVRPWLVENAGISGKTGGSAINLDYHVADAILVATARAAIEPDRA
jgi:hypothetical protein